MCRTRKETKPISGRTSPFPLPPCKVLGVHLKSRSEIQNNFIQALALDLSMKPIEVEQHLVVKSVQEFGLRELVRQFTQFPQVEHAFVEHERLTGHLAVGIR